MFPGLDEEPTRPVKQRPAGGFGPPWIAGADLGDEMGVLVDEGLEGRHEAGRLEADEGAQEPDLGLPDPVEPLVPRNAAERPVKGEVGVDEGDSVAGGGRPAHLVEGGLERSAVGRIAAGDDEPGGSALEGRPHLIDLLDLAGIENRDEGASTRILVDEALGPEHRQSFPDRPPARLELTGDVRLDEPEAGREGPGQDPLAQELGRRLGEGSACKGWQLKLVHITVGC